MTPKKKAARKLATPKVAKPAAPADQVPSTRVARDRSSRPLTDPREMRALAHPVRLALLDAITRDGPLTATSASEQVGESPANCSFHLRTLAKYGFVEEAPGGSGRARPWRRVTLGESFDTDYGDAETTHAAQALASVHLERAFAKVRDALSSRRHMTARWRNSSYLRTRVLYLTADELAAMGEEIEALHSRYRDRTLDRGSRPAGARAVQMLEIGAPLPPTPSGN